MKRYLLFAGELYYPGGGWKDFIDSYDSADDAIAEGRKMFKGPRGHMVNSWDWYHVIDSKTGDFLDTPPAEQETP